MRPFITTIGLALLALSAACSPAHHGPAHQTLHVIRMTAIDRADVELEATRAILLEVITQRDQAAAEATSLRATVDDQQKQIDDLKGQLTARSGFGGGGSPAGNRFVFGQCTWYVYNRRPIPWMGNAIEWWANARPFGYAEGSVPRIGAIMVSAEGHFGHVSYVEAVNGDGSWVVSEMNWTAWDYVDWRTVRWKTTPVIGFIY